MILLVDGTASMADPIKSVQENLPKITDKILAEQPDSRFAVATFGDQEGDPNAGFSVLQGLTDDLEAVQAGVNKLDTALGGRSRGPSEDWINGLWQIANGAGGQTVFRDGASPVIVLVGDASSHAPSNGHSIDDTIFDLQDRSVRVIGVDVASKIGDGLNGNGDAGDPEYVEDPLTTPDQATRIINATNGRLLEGIDGDKVAEAIAEGFNNLPTTVGYRLDNCDPSLTVALDPPTRSVTSGDTASFAENIDVAADAPQGTTLTCTVQFLMGTQVPGTETIEYGRGRRPGLPGADQHRCERHRRARRHRGRSDRPGQGQEGRARDVRRHRPGRHRRHAAGDLHPCLRFALPGRPYHGELLGDGLGGQHGDGHGGDRGPGGSRTALGGCGDEGRRQP